MAERRDAVERREPLPDVGVAGGELQPALLAVRPDDDGDRAWTVGRVADLLELVLLRVVGDLLAREERDDDRQRFLEPVHPLAHRLPRSMPWAMFSKATLPAPRPGSTGRGWRGRWSPPSWRRAPGFGTCWPRRGARAERGSSPGPTRRASSSPRRSPGRRCHRSNRGDRGPRYRSSPYRPATGRRRAPRPRSSRRSGSGRRP